MLVKEGPAVIGNGYLGWAVWLSNHTYEPVKQLLHELWEVIYTQNSPKDAMKSLYIQVQFIHDLTDMHIVRSY